MSREKYQATRTGSRKKYRKPKRKTRGFVKHGSNAIINPGTRSINQMNGFATAAEVVQPSSASETVSHTATEKTSEDDFQIQIPSYIRRILDLITKLGFQAMLKGGAVRDFILQVEPNDIDIVTNATREQLDYIFKQNGLEPRINKHYERLVQVVVNGTQFDLISCEAASLFHSPVDFNYNSYFADSDGRVFTNQGELVTTNPFADTPPIEYVNADDDPILLMRGLNLKISRNLEFSEQAVRRNKELIPRLASNTKSRGRVFSYFIKSIKKCGFKFMDELLQMCAFQEWLPKVYEVYESYNQAPIHFIEANINAHLEKYSHLNLVALILTPVVYYAHYRRDRWDVGIDTLLNLYFLTKPGTYDRDYLQKLQDCVGVMIHYGYQPFYETTRSNFNYHAMLQQGLQQGMVPGMFWGARPQVIPVQVQTFSPGQEANYTIGLQ